jgi:hypothetical protein
LERQPAAPLAEAAMQRARAGTGIITAVGATTTAPVTYLRALAEIAGDEGVWARLDGAPLLERQPAAALAEAAMQRARAAAGIIATAGATTTAPSWARCGGVTPLERQTAAVAEAAQRASATTTTSLIAVADAISRVLANRQAVVASAAATARAVEDARRDAISMILANRQAGAAGTLLAVYNAGANTIVIPRPRQTSRVDVAICPQANGTGSRFWVAHRELLRLRDASDPKTAGNSAPDTVAPTTTTIGDASTNALSEPTPTSVHRLAMRRSLSPCNVTTAGAAMRRVSNADEPRKERPAKVARHQSKQQVNDGSDDGVDDGDDDGAEPPPPAPRRQHPLPHDADADDDAVDEDTPPLPVPPQQGSV